MGSAPFIRLDADERPYLEGVRCGACREVLAIEPRRACPRCAAIGKLEPVRLAERGRLYAYTVVHRSFPGVKVPFVAAVVDLEGGGSFEAPAEVHGGRAYLTNGHAFAVDPATGDVLWTREPGDEEDRVFSVRVVGDTLLAETWRGRSG